MLDAASSSTCAQLYSNDRVNMTLVSTYSTEINKTQGQISAASISTRQIAARWERDLTTTLHKSET